MSRGGLFKSTCILKVVSGTFTMSLRFKESWAPETFGARQDSLKNRRELVVYNQGLGTRDPRKTKIRT